MLELACQGAQRGWDFVIIGQNTGMHKVPRSGADDHCSASHKLMPMCICVVVQVSSQMHALCARHCKHPADGERPNLIFGITLREHKHTTVPHVRALMTWGQAARSRNHATYTLFRLGLFGERACTVIK